jgi:hypothetical protein
MEIPQGPWGPLGKKRTGGPPAFRRAATRSRVRFQPSAITIEQEISMRKRKPKRAIVESREMRALRESLTYSSTDDDAPPKDMDVFRYAFTRKICTFLGEPRNCSAPVCRRTLRCASPDMRCCRNRPSTMTPEEWDRAKAEILVALKRRLAEAELL